MVRRRGFIEEAELHFMSHPGAHNAAARRRAFIDRAPGIELGGEMRTADQPDLEARGLDACGELASRFLPRADDHVIDLEQRALRRPA